MLESNSLSRQLRFLTQNAPIDVEFGLCNANLLSNLLQSGFYHLHRTPCQNQAAVWGGTLLTSVPALAKGVLAVLDAQPTALTGRGNHSTLQDNQTKPVFRQDTGLRPPRNMHGDCRSVLSHGNVTTHHRQKRGDRLLVAEFRVSQLKLMLMYSNTFWPHLRQRQASTTDGDIWPDTLQRRAEYGCP